MKVDLVQIGNSRGIRIPKPLIEQCGLGDRVELRVENNCLVIAPERGLREGWEQAFQSAGDASGDELLIDDTISNEFDWNEWRW